MNYPTQQLLANLSSLGLIACCFMGISLAADSQQRPRTAVRESDIQKGQSQETTANAANKNSHAPIAANADGSPPHNPVAETKQTETCDPRKDTLYRRYLWATVIGVFGGFLGIFAIWRQGNIAQKTADALANIERGWLLVGTINPISSNTPPKGVAPVSCFVCHLQNFGKTPVRILQKAERFHQVRELDRLPEEPFYGTAGNIEGDWYVAQGGHITVIAYLESKKLLIIADPSEWAAHGHLHGLGFVKYEDAFGRPHETQYSYVYDPSQPENIANGYFRRAGPAKYNRAT